MSQAHTQMLTVRTDKDGVRFIVFDAPGEPVNTLRSEFAEEVSSVLSAVEEDDSVRAVVLVSAKQDNFIAGADISMLSKVTSAEEATQLSETGQRAVSLIERCRVPVVAAIHGACLGGGLEIALACHGRVASHSEKSKMGLPEVQLGILPGMGGTVRLPQLVGLSKALDLLLTGKQLSGKRALSIGLVDEVVPEGILGDVARKRALMLAEARSKSPSRWRSLRDLLDPGELKELALADNPLGRKVVFDAARKSLLEKTRGNYPAPEKILSVVRTGLEQGAEAGYREEASAFGELVVSSEAAALRHVYFSGQSLRKMENRSNTPVKAARRIGVLGAGLMGTGVAYVSAALADVHVRLEDKDEEGLSRGLQAVARLLDERVKRRRLTVRKREELLAKITRTTGLSGFGSLDVIIEAVFEDLELKRSLLAQVEEQAGEPIFASNTSSLPISSIAEGARHPERVIGMHYFSPVHRMPLLEIITTDRTADWVIDTCVELGRRQQKTVIVVGDGPGFYTTRILGPYLNEAAYCLIDGRSISAIDQELVQAGFPIGPLALLDEIGIDVGTKVVSTLREALGERLAPPAQLAELAEQGRKGKKNKSGFYDYQAKDSSKRPVDDSVYEVLGLSIPSKKSEDGGLGEPGSVAERCVLSMVNEAAHCLGEGILKTPRDGDVGAIYGLGFPPFLGGPFHFVDAQGPREIVDRLRRLERSHGSRFAPAPRLVSMAESDSRFFR